MIEDEEFRELFKVECEEHLQRLDEGLLRLEREAGDRETLEEMFRGAHSLKGAARMVGVGGVERIAHRFEDVLGAARRGEVVLDAGLADRLYRNLDAIRRLVEEAVGGQPAGVDVEGVLAEFEEVELSAAEGEEGGEGEDDLLEQGAGEQDDGPEAALARVGGGPSPKEEEEGAEVSAEGPAGARPDPPAPESGAQKAGPPRSNAYHIDTVRVPSEQLDALMRQVGELSVTHSRMARRLAEFDALLALWEEWSREVTTWRLARSGAGKAARDLAESQSLRLEELGRWLERVRGGAREDQDRLERVAAALEESVRGARLLPLETLFRLFPRMVRDLARQQGKEIELGLEGAQTTADKRIIEELKDPLTHMLRNAVDHGIEAPAERQEAGKERVGRLLLRAFQRPGAVVVEIVDDGRGLDPEKIRQTALRRKVRRAEELAEMTTAQLYGLIFASGFSTSAVITDVSGRGVGMDVVRTNVERLKGRVEVESEKGRGSVFRLVLPATMATTRVLVARVRGRSYAAPVECVHTTCQVRRADIFPVEGRDTFILEGQPVSVRSLAELLELGGEDGEQETAPCLVVGVGGALLGLLVDDLVDEEEVVVQMPGGLLRRVRNVSGAAILATGQVCMVLNAEDLLRSAQKRGAAPRGAGEREEPEHRPLILLAEDSITTRTQEKRILEGAGYEVVVAVDGADALEKLRARAFAAVVSDVEMPRLDGLELTRRIRRDRRYRDLPIILVTSLASDEDRRRGEEAGADAYIAKSGFDQQVLLDTVRRLV